MSTRFITYSAISRTDILYRLPIYVKSLFELTDHVILTPPPSFLVSLPLKTVSGKVADEAASAVAGKVAGKVAGAVAGKVAGRSAA